MSQIFKSPVEPIVLFNILEKICIKTENKYVLDNASYKKATLLELIEPFIETIKPNYHLSKQYYCLRKPSYKMLTTIIRQICRSNNIFYKQNIIYRQSKYEIIYSIFYNSSNFVNSPKTSKSNSNNSLDKLCENTYIDQFNE